jgi:methylated-DNA-protein-cysteine methyltransferase-like protein
MDAFHQNVLKIVRTIPSGKVASYGQIAAYVGAPKAAREVGWAMNSLGGTPDFPWWRVLNNTGAISIDEKAEAGPQRQQALLEKEGVVFEKPLLLDIERYRYQADKATLSNFGLRPEYIDDVIEKFAPKGTGRLFGV